MSFTTQAVNSTVNSMDDLHVIENEKDSPETVFTPSLPELSKGHLSNFLGVLTTVALLSLSYWANSSQLSAGSSKIQPVPYLNHSSLALMSNSTNQP